MFGPLGDGRQEDILRRRQAMDRRGMVLRQVVGIKSGLIQLLNLDEPVGIDLLEVHAWNRFDVVEDTELQSHVAPPY
jgi:hypothetical protein